MDICVPSLKKSILPQKITSLSFSSDFHDFLQLFFFALPSFYLRLKPAGQGDETFVLLVVPIDGGDYFQSAEVFRRCVFKKACWYSFSSPLPPLENHRFSRLSPAFFRANPPFDLCYLLIFLLGGRLGVCLFMRRLQLRTRTQRFPMLKEWKFFLHVK